MQQELFNRSLTAYYNTVNYSGEELKQRQEKAQSQEATVIHFFTITPPYEFTASEVVKALEPVGIIDKSVRRSLSTLCKKRMLEKQTDKLKMGPLGSNEHYYKLIKP